MGAYSRVGSFKVLVLEGWIKVGYSRVGASNKYNYQW